MTRSLLLCAIAAVSTLGAFGVTEAAPTALPRQFQQYFGCPTGHTLNVHPDLAPARCVGADTLRSQVTCPAGYVRIDDFVLTDDRCVSRAGPMAAATCPARVTPR